MSCTTNNSISSNRVTIRASGGGGLALTPQYSRVTLECVGSNEWLMFK